MDEFNFDTDLVELARLDSYHDLANFDCGDTEMNQFFLDEAYEEQEKGLNSTTLLFFKGEIAAFVSICCDAIPLNTNEQAQIDIQRSKVPAIKIARLGKHIKFEKCSFGRFLIDYVKDLAYRLHTTVLGIRFITLDAYPDKINYYENSGFIRNIQANSRKRDDGAVSMRSDIFD